jgi:hypothetical protein
LQKKISLRQLYVKRCELAEAHRWRVGGGRGANRCTADQQSNTIYTCSPLGG